MLFLIHKIMEEENNTALPENNVGWKRKKFRFTIIWVAKCDNNFTIYLVKYYNNH